MNCRKNYTPISLLSFDIHVKLRPMLFSTCTTHVMHTTRLIQRKCHKCTLNGTKRAHCMYLNQSMMLFISSEFSHRFLLEWSCKSIVSSHKWMIFFVSLCAKKCFESTGKDEQIAPTLCDAYANVVGLKFNRIRLYMGYLAISVWLSQSAINVCWDATLLATA